MGVLDNKIVVHHVGGFGDFGPSEQINTLRDVHWVIYDAREAALETAKQLAVSHEFMRKCVGAQRSKAEFNVTEQESASSLLEPAAKAANYTILSDRGRIVWGRHAKVKKKVEVDVVPLDELLATEHVAPPDFLSIDAQGAEPLILQGASKTIDGHVLGVLLETEFSELYERQGLFSGTSDFLGRKGFRLCEVYNIDRANVYPYAPELMGRGFLIWGESLFLREYETLRSREQQLKLAALAVAFDQLDYAMQICQHMLDSPPRQQSDLYYERLLGDLCAEFAEENSHAPPSKEWKDDAAIPRANGFVLAGLFLKLFGRTASKKLFGRYSSKVARTLKLYGLKAVADRQEVRSFVQGYKRRGIYSQWLDLAAEFGLRIL